MNIISKEDKLFALDLMKKFNIKGLRFRFDPSEKEWPDIWITDLDSEIPLITVTQEWQKQDKEERHKRLVHEVLHITGLNHGQKGKLNYSTYPEKDSYSKAVYEQLKNPFLADLGTAAILGAGFTGGSILANLAGKKFLKAKNPSTTSKSLLIPLNLKNKKEALNLLGQELYDILNEYSYFAEKRVSDKKVDNLYNKIKIFVIDNEGVGLPFYGAGNIQQAFIDAEQSNDRVDKALAVESFISALHQDNYRPLTLFAGKEKFPEKDEAVGKVLEYLFRHTKKKTVNQASKIHNDRYWDSYYKYVSEHPEFLKEKNPENITTVIENLILKYNKTPEEINSGECEDFAVDVIKSMGGYETGITDMSTDLSNKYEGHVWIKYKNKFYDAAHPKGVDNWKKLFPVKHNNPSSATSVLNWVQTRFKNPENIESYRSSFRDVFNKTLLKFQQIFPGGVSGRIKSSESIIEKLGRRNKKIEELTDIAGIRVVFLTLDTLYSGLDKIRSKFNVVEEENYINQPRKGYRSYHLIIMVEGKPIEIQLKTLRMFDWSEKAHDTVYKNRSLLVEKYGEKIVDQAENYMSSIADYYNKKDEGQEVKKPKAPRFWDKLKLPLFMLNPDSKKC